MTNMFDVNYEKNLRPISLIKFFTLPLLIKLIYNQKDETFIDIFYGISQLS